jgi:hypothetical protein
MTFYRVSYSRDGGNSGGYSWHTSYAAALKAFRADYNEDQVEYFSAFKPDEYIDEITITPTKAGILDALNNYAGYNDNG